MAVRANRETEMSENEDKSLPVARGLLLPTLDSPADLRRLSVEQLPQLCREIREYLIDNLSQNPGHFGSSMGAVDLIVAIHYVFDTPRDRLVFDVGHQAYAHKLLTGRREAFRSQRTKGGISGFPFPHESGYDTFVCGHAGNSISAALGMAVADLNTPGEEDRHAVALIGDASISNGLAFEGLNNVSNNPNNLLIVLNDNDMSIDNNVGALHNYLSEITTTRRYNRFRYHAYNFCRHHGLIDERKKGIMLRFSNALKSAISRQQTIFDGLNIRDVGPFNGNDVTKMVKVLRDIKEMKGPRILHVHTQKGYGFAPAEENPPVWHAPGKFDPVTGERLKGNGSQLLWQDVFGETLAGLAETRPEITGITAAMPTGTSMNRMMRFPDRFFDVGISEGHAVTFAGGLAAAGKKPFVAIYSSFLQRGLDNIIHDVAIQGLPVTFCIDRAGLVGEDGVTHHGLYDITFLRMIPGMTVASPMDAATLRDLLYTATDFHAPLSIRYPRGKAGETDMTAPMSRIEPGKGRALSVSDCSRVAILSFGPIGTEAIRALELLKDKGISADLYDMIWAKPLDTGIIDSIAAADKAIVTIEDGALEGGFGSAVAEYLAEKGSRVPVRRLGVPDRWVMHGSVSQLREECGIDAAAIVRAVEAFAGLSGTDEKKKA